MKPVKDAKKYAKMFISVVGLEDTPNALSGLMTVEDLMARSKDFRIMLSNPGFSQPERESALKGVASKINLSEKVLKFVLYLIEVGAITALPHITRSATAIYLERKKRAKATVLTPVEFDKGREDRLKKALKSLIDRDVDIEYVMDSSLLGGVLVKVGSTMYDSSLKGQLRLIKDELIKG